MKYALLLCLGVLGNTQFVWAEELSSCHNKCFESKAECNAEQSHTFNACHEALTACKMSCHTGKPHETYHATPLLKVSFNPLTESEIL